MGFFVCLFGFKDSKDDDSSGDNVNLLFSFTLEGMYHSCQDPTIFELSPTMAVDHPGFSSIGLQKQWQNKTTQDKKKGVN